MPDTPTEPLPDPTPVFVPIAEQFVEGDHPTDNPDGVTVSNVDYTPKTQEEKAELLRVEMVEVTNLDLDPTEPYPTGSPMTEEERLDYLKSLHSPQELVPAEKWDEANTANLAAGGSVDQAELSAKEE
jgi:hypothetical protein